MKTTSMRRWAAAGAAAVAAITTFGVIAPGTEAQTPPPAQCPNEDGLAVLTDAGLGLDETWVLLSGGIHSGTEGDWTYNLVDPITVPLLGLNTTALVHSVSCDVVAPVEDAVDEITIPLVNALGLRELLDGLGL